MGERHGFAYGDDLAQAFEHIALIATVEKLLNLRLVEGPGGVARVPGGGGGVKSELLSCTELSVPLCS